MALTFPYIKKTVLVDEKEYWPGHLNNTAGSDPLTGIVYINRDMWPTLDKAEQQFVLAHENAHLALNTDNECEADRYAFWWLVDHDSSYDPYKASIALDKTLSFYKQDPVKYDESLDREQKMLRRATVYSNL